jgi:hypothetical protein
MDTDEALSGFDKVEEETLLVISERQLAGGVENDNLEVLESGRREELLGFVREVTSKPCFGPSDFRISSDSGSTACLNPFDSVT